MTISVWHQLASFPKDEVSHFPRSNRAEDMGDALGHAGLMVTFAT